MSLADMSLLALIAIALGELIAILRMRSTLKRWKKKVRLSDRITGRVMRDAGSEL